VGWYGSSYTLACSSLQLLVGKVYTFYPVKPTLIASVILFELGSAVCGAAPSSVAFIVGRAIAGAGSAGIFSGCVRYKFILCFEERKRGQSGGTKSSF
jgi:MFS family permease